jgi:hypothetical protein
MERENQNAENLLFQIKQLQKEGVKVGVFKDIIENQIWENSEKKLNPERPRWKIIDKDEGVLFARKDYPDKTRHMDILEGTDDDNRKYKSIIIYDVGNEERPIMVRSNGKKPKL